MLMNGGIAGLRGPSTRAIHGADVRAGDRLRRHVAGVPVVLVPRVQDVPEVGQHVRADQRRRDPSPSATFSRPWQILMLSTAVSIAGNVLRTFSTGRPTSNGV